MRFIPIYSALCGSIANACIRIQTSETTVKFLCTPGIDVTISGDKIVFEFGEENSITLYSDVAMIPFKMSSVELRFERENHHAIFDWKGIGGGGSISFDYSLVDGLRSRDPKFRKNFDSAEVSFSLEDSDSTYRTLNCFDAHEGLLIGEFKAPRKLLAKKYALGNGDTPADLVIMNAMCNKALDWLVAITQLQDDRAGNNYEVGSNKLCAFQYSSEEGGMHAPICFGRSNIPSRSLGEWGTLFGSSPIITSENGLVIITCDEKERYIAISGSDADPFVFAPRGTDSVRTDVLKTICRRIKLLRSAERFGLVQAVDTMAEYVGLNDIEIRDQERGWTITRTSSSHIGPENMRNHLFTVTEDHENRATYLAFGQLCQIQSRFESESFGGVCGKVFDIIELNEKITCSSDLAYLQLDSAGNIQNLQNAVLFDNYVDPPYLLYPCQGPDVDVTA